MARWIIGQAGIITNIVEAPTLPLSEVANGFDVILDEAGIASVGGAYDPKDVQLRDILVPILQMLFRHENLSRQIIRSIRTNAGINTAATSNGLPTSANAADVTVAQFKAFMKTLF